MEKRFIYGLASEWYGAKSVNESKFADSIVFIKNDGWNGTTNTKGDAIWAQGAYFEMNNTADVQGIIEGYLKEGKNIDIEVADGGLKISAVSIDSISGLATADETKLVEAKAVAGALTNPFKLTLAVTDNKGQFTQHFKNLKGEDVTFASAIIEGGNGITLTQTTDGLKIDADLADLKAGLDYNSGNVITVNTEDRTINHNEVAATTKSTGAAINPSAASKSFDIKSYGFDKYGHIESETTTTVTLPDTAFSDDNTEYELSVVKQEGDSGKSQYDVNLVNKDTKAIADTVTFVPGANVAMALNGTKGIEVIATDTKYEVSATANATKGVDVNLVGTDKSTDSVTFVGGSNVEVSLTADGKVEISSSFENDNTTYTGENAIVVAQPEEGKTEGKVSLKLVDGENILSQDGSGLKSTLTIDYDKSSNNIQLKGIGGAVVSEFNASAFVEDSFLKDVEIVDTDGENTGKFLKFTFETVDTDGTGDIDDLTKVIYVDVATWFHETTVEGNEATYSVVEAGTTDNGSAKYTVKNTLGAITRDNETNTITTTNGLATVADIKDVIETISSVTSADSTVAGEGEVTVVTAVKQEKGRVEVTTGTAATKTYVDGLIEGLDSGVKTAKDAPVNADLAKTAANDAGSANQTFTRIVIEDGELVAEKCQVSDIDKAQILNVTKTAGYVNLSNTDSIASAFDKCEAAWDWSTISNA